MKVAISVTPFQCTTPIEELISRAASAGFDAVELGIGAEGSLACDTPEAEYRRIGEQVRQAGLEVSAVVAEMAVVGGSISSRNAVGRDARRLLAEALDRACWLGAGTVIVQRPRRDLGETGQPTASWEVAYATALKFLLDARFDAQKQAIGVACDVDWLPCEASAIGVRRFIDEINSPWVGVCLDLAGTHSASLSDWLSLLGHRILRIRYSEPGSAGEGHNAGKAALNWPGVLSGIRAIRYPGPIACVPAGDFATAKAKLDALLAQTAAAPGGSSPI